MVLSQSRLAVAEQQTLPQKYQNIFDKQILPEYESDDFRECIKNCDRILQVYPKHGETNSMKGLCLHCLGSVSADAEDEGKEKAFDAEEEDKNRKLRERGMKLIGEGLRCNLKSSICWRVKGLAHRSEKDFVSAIKSYKMAKVYDAKNQRIYLDLAALQVQGKQFGEFCKTQKELWLLNEDKMNTVGYCMALYLNRDYAKCGEFIDEHLLNDALDQKLKIEDAVEINELFLLKAKLLIKQKLNDNALQFLREKVTAKLILDKLRAFQMMVDLSKSLNRFDDATKYALDLVDQNPENLNYLKQYLSLKTSEGTMDPMECLEELKGKYPKSKAIKRVLLEYIGDAKQMEEAVGEYLVSKFKRSVPSLYNDVKSLYEDKSKGKAIDKLVEMYRSELKDHYRFRPEDDRLSASPMCLLWVNYFYCSRLVDIGAFEEALSAIDEAIEIVPTCIELHVLKARCFKYSGNALMASQYMDYARSMDTADRYLNTKCVRYALRALRMKEAEEMVVLFLKKSEGTVALQSLQVMWYQLHKAEGHLKLREYGPAIKQYQNVFGHFETFWKNLTDFHRYSYRKCAINGYLDLLDWEFALRDHPFFLRAASKAMGCWFDIMRLRREEKWEELERGSLKWTQQQRDADRKGHRQKDERGWRLIHCNDPMTKIKGWIDHLVPLMDALKERNTPFDAQMRIEVHFSRIKYSFYAQKEEELKENIERVQQEKEELEKNAYFVFAAFNAIDDMKGYQGDNAEAMKTVIEPLCSQFTAEYLKCYYESAGDDVEKLIALIRCLQIAKDSGLSVGDIVERIKKLDCSPMQCVEIREVIATDKDTSHSFENYVKDKYPLQLRIRNLE